MALARVHVVVWGRVQGVWFRGSTQAQARSRGVRGWVRNRLDGTVEAVLEGEEDAVRAVVEWCRRGPPGARVEEVEVAWEPYRGEFDRMSIAGI
jgi:acylphosphatase